MVEDDICVLFDISMIFKPSNIEKNGGKNVGSISAKTSIILAGENMGPAKLEKAKKLGITILSEDEFLKLIS